MINFFKSTRFQLIGSAYFFECFSDFGNFNHDRDFGAFVDTIPEISEVFTEANTCRTSINGNDYFIWKKYSPEKLVELAFTKDPMCSGKYLIPELCETVGFTIDHLKQLSSVFDNMDYKHRYEKIIYDAYMNNNGFYLTDQQRFAAYLEYKKDRFNLIIEESYELKRLKWVIYFNRPKKFPFQHNMFGRPTGLLGAFLISEKEQQFAIDTYYYLKKYYPEVYAYESVNYDSLKKDFILDSYSLNLEGSKKVLDIDIKDCEDYIYIQDVEVDLKEFLLLKKIHCDLQRSPHGFHLIIHNDIEKSRLEIRNFFDSRSTLKRKFLIQKRIFKSLPYVDVLTNVKTLDGIDINGFNIETIKDWT